MKARWGELLEAWLEELRTQHRAPGTLRVAEFWAVAFVQLCEAAGTGPEGIDETHVVAFQRSLKTEPGPKGGLYGSASVTMGLRTARLFVRWLVPRAGAAC